MNSMSAKKLPKAERRDQLLSTALEITRAQGTDALTLGWVAEQAGVSKPVVYEHFGSRSGLLIALYKKIDEQQVAIALEALDRAPRTLQDAARVLSRAWMNCYNTIGPEWHAISAALKGTEEREAFQNELMDEYVAIYVKAFSPYVKLSKNALRLRCVAILGAVESISREMLRGKISETTASDVLVSLIVDCLSPNAASRAKNLRTSKSNS